MTARFVRMVCVGFVFGCLFAPGCASSLWFHKTAKRPLRRPPPEQFPAHEIEFSDSDGFDVMLESALVSRRPSIVIQTNAKSPAELDHRINTWVSAWMDGGELDVPNSKGLGASQVILLGLEIANSEEFDKFMTSAQEKAGEVADWYNDRKLRDKRVGLLKPYVLAFENPKDGGAIQIRLYNGLYDQFSPSPTLEPQVASNAPKHGEKESIETTALTKTAMTESKNEPSVATAEKSESQTNEVVAHVGHTETASQAK